MRKKSNLGSASDVFHMLGYRMVCRVKRLEVSEHPSEPWALNIECHRSQVLLSGRAKPSPATSDKICLVTLLSGPWTYLEQISS
jgi:hypothetical protein